MMTYASRMMKLSKIGSGVMTAAKTCPELELVDDREAGLFRAIFPRRFG